MGMKELLREFIRVNLSDIFSLNSRVTMNALDGVGLPMHENDLDDENELELTEYDESISSIDV